MSELLLCYNRGCGQKFDLAKNTAESCRHHSGIPVFHDAYKGWSCCKKKCTDFTEFLNIKGCTVSFHSNVKPPEPEKPAADKPTKDELIVVKPLVHVYKKIERPPFDSPLTILKPVVSSNLKNVASLTSTNKDSDDTNEKQINFENIPIGTQCKNNSCKVVYDGVHSLNEICTYHPGYPVFHEGLKFWTCCTKRTTDFASFLSQVGCSTGNHIWLKKREGEVKCRLDWHQTGSFVFVSIYGKNCDPEASVIELSPVRLKLSIYFPEQIGTFKRDMELCGIVDVKNSSVSITASKIEIKLHKNNAGSWSKLDIPNPEINITKSIPKDNKEESLESRVESVDLNFI